MRYLISFFAVAMLGLLSLTGCNNAAKPVAVEPAPKSNSTPTTASTNAVKTDSHGHEDNAPRITLAEAKKDFDAGNAVFIDTRAEVQYKPEHIKGALNIPAEAAATRYKEIPTGKKIIAYCSWPDEHSSAGLVTELKKKGIENAYALVGGTAAWKSAGYPMEGEASKK